MFSLDDRVKERSLKGYPQSSMIEGSTKMDTLRKVKEIEPNTVESTQPAQNKMYDPGGAKERSLEESPPRYTLTIEGSKIMDNLGKDQELVKPKADESIQIAQCSLSGEGNTETVFNAEKVPNGNVYYALDQMIDMFSNLGLELDEELQHPVEMVLGDTTSTSAEDNDVENAELVLPSQSYHHVPTRVMPGINEEKLDFLSSALANATSPPAEEVNAVMKVDRPIDKTQEERSAAEFLQSMSNLMTGKPLDGTTINDSQEIFHKIFATQQLDIGLQDVRLGSTYEFVPYGSQFYVQVLHTTGLGGFCSHWVAVTNCTCNAGEIVLMDSQISYDKDNNPRIGLHVLNQMRQIMYGRTSDRIKVRVAPVQQQKNDTFDCGVFAIAFIQYVLEHRRVPENVVFRDEMRYHLWTGLQKGNIEMFPTVEGANEKEMEWREVVKH